MRSPIPLVVAALAFVSVAAVAATDATLQPLGRHAPVPAVSQADAQEARDDHALRSAQEYGQRAPSAREGAAMPLDEGLGGLIDVQELGGAAGELVPVVPALLGGAR